MIIIKNMMNVTLYQSSEKELPSSKRFANIVVHDPLFHLYYHDHDNFKNNKSLTMDMSNLTSSRLRSHLKKFKLVRSAESIYRKRRISIFIIKYRILAKIQKKNYTFLSYWQDRRNSCQICFKEL